MEAYIGGTLRLIVDGQHVATGSMTGTFGSIGMILGHYPNGSTGMAGMIDIFAVRRTF